MKPRLTILHKGLILIAVPLLFQFVFIAVLAQLRREGSIAVDWTIHTKEVIAQAQTSRVALIEAHRMIQGYVITSDPSDAENLNRAIARVPREIMAVRNLVVDRTDQTRAALLIHERAVEFLRFVEEGKSRIYENQMDAGSAVSWNRQAQKTLDSLEADFDRFVAFERTLDKIRQERLEQARNSINTFITVGLGASVISTVVLAIVFSRNISGRITHLTDNAHRLAEGKELTPSVSGGDEIARLDLVFHEMAQTLSEAAERERQQSRLQERRAGELAIVNAQLRDKAQENEMFVYSVSHDLRSPLVNLQGFSKELGMIGNDLGKLLDQDQIPPEVRQRARAMIESDMKVSIDFIKTAVTRLSGIIDGLLRLSRAGKVEYRTQFVETTPIVNRVVTALRGTIDERHATVKVGELPPTFGDPTAIEQIFANLIGNAINYLDKTRPGKIDVFAVDPRETGGPVEGIAAGLVVFAVRDNGLGIPESYKGKVFAVFQRLHGDVAKGEGVGLALVRRMVERHGGRVWFESNPGEGTTFFVSLPDGQPRVVELAEGANDVPSLVTASTEVGRSGSWQPNR